MFPLEDADVSEVRMLALPPGAAPRGARLRQRGRGPAAVAALRAAEAHRRLRGAGPAWRVIFLVVVAPSLDFGFGPPAPFKPT